MVDRTLAALLLLPLACGAPGEPDAELAPAAADEPADEPPGEHDHAHEPEPDGPDYYQAALPALAAYDCAEKKATGYVKGAPFEITVVTVDGKPVEVATADAYLAMQAKATADGVGLKVVSGFRTMAEQEYLYACYINCNCNNCNLAAKPGYSNHQSGHALDLNSSAPGVSAWLNANANAFGFARTVPSEPWHWEWWGGGPPTDGPCGKPLFAAAPAGQSFPAADDPPILLQVGETYQGWFELHNAGKAAWGDLTYLAPEPGDTPSPLADPSWAAPHRVGRVDAATPSGEVGRFTFTIRGNTPGEFHQPFALVEEAEDDLTWFASGLLALHVLVIDPPPPVPEPEPEPEPDTTHGDSTTTAPDPADPDPTAAPDPVDPDSTAAPDPDPNPTAPTTATDPTADAEDEASCACRAAPANAAPLPLLALLLLLARPRPRRP